MEFNNGKDLEQYIYEKLQMSVDVDKVRTISDGQLIREGLRLRNESTIERLIDRKLDALESGRFEEARAAQEIYSKYCDVDKDSGAYTVRQENRLVEVTNGALERLSNELKDTSWRSPEEKKELLSECEDFLATVDGVKQTEGVDLTEFKDNTDRLRSEIPPEEKQESEVEAKAEEEARKDVEDEQNLDSENLGMEHVPAHERNEAEDIKQESVKEEKEKDLPDDKKQEPANARMVKIDSYESMYEKAKHKIRELFSKIKNAIMPREQDVEKDMDNDGR